MPLKGAPAEALQEEGAPQAFPQAAHAKHDFRASASKAQSHTREAFAKFWLLAMPYKHKARKAREKTGSHGASRLCVRAANSSCPHTMNK